MNFQILDWIVIVAYIFLIFYLAIQASNSEKINHGQLSFAEDKYLAGKSLSFTEAICSIIATEVSALTFLGIPAFAFKSDFSFIQIYFGAIIGRFIIAAIFIPKIYNQGLTIYEIMGKNSPHQSGKKTVAIFYTIAKILSVGVRLFSGSILIAQFFNINLYLGLGLVTLVTFFYTLIGGLKAVVRTDIFQMIIFIIGGIVAHIMIPIESETSWYDLITLAHNSGKTSILNLSNPYPFLFGIMGGIVFDMATHGVDQDFAQRLIASKDIKTAKSAIFLSSFLSISVGLIFLGVGALLWSHYQANPIPKSVQGADHLFAHFIVNHFPSGIRGLMVAGVLAATMSTLDSTINAISATLYNDVFNQNENSQFKSNSLQINIIATALLFLVAVFTAQNDGLLLLGLKIQSWTAGSLLGLFISTVLAKNFFNYRFDFISVFGAYLAGTFGVYLNSQILAWDWNLNVYWGCFLSLIFLKIYSTLNPQLK